MKYINVASGIIIRKNKDSDEILIIKRSKDDHWPLMHEIPRGKCNHGESIKDCLKREVKEETGLDIIPIKLIDKFEYIADQGKRKSTSYNFLCKLVDEKQPIKLSKEHEDYFWIKSMGEVNIHVMPEIAKSIAKVFNYDKSIYSPPYNKNEIEQIEEYLNYLNKEK